MALVNGNRELGQLAARFCIDKLVILAREHGVGVVGLRNASRYSRLTTYGSAIAERGLVGIVLNSGGPPAVIPANGIDPIFGTNPICFAFPEEQQPLVLDFSTSERVWGEIRQAMLENRPLPGGAFLDKDGATTVSPENAEAVLPFGGHKGYALCLAIEILCGALVGAKMGRAVNDQFDLGFLFIAMDPRAFDVEATLPKEISTLLTSVRQSRGSEPGQTREFRVIYPAKPEQSWRKRGRYS